MLAVIVVVVVAWIIFMIVWIYVDEELVKQQQALLDLQRDAIGKADVAIKALKKYVLWLELKEKINDK